jgi:hypothetical protein
MTINELVYKVYYILGGNCYREQFATTTVGALNLHMHTSGVKHMQRVTKLIINRDNLNHAIMILLNWRYVILTHMSVTVVAPTCQ